LLSYTQFLVVVQFETAPLASCLCFAATAQHFLRYAGRYARRPPIAQRRIIEISQQEIKFLAKDRRLHRQVTVRLTPKEFLAAWTQHIPERYEHAVRSFVRMLQGYGRTSGSPSTADKSP
jgi:hypothetical protein